MALIKAKEYESGLNAVVPESEYREALMGFEVLKAPAGEAFRLEYGKECALLLLEGKAELGWDGRNVVVERISSFHDAPYCLCVPKGVGILVKGLEGGAQFAVVTAENEKVFDPMLYTPNDIKTENRGEGTLNECSTRIFRIIRSRKDCPHTNLFFGEVINMPGKWSSYPPHSHMEPEIYYYHSFLPSGKGGFGFAQEGQKAHIVQAGDALLVTEGDAHAQAAAPGYAMYYIWLMRDFDEKPFVPAPPLEQYAWTVEGDAKFFPDI